MKKEKRYTRHELVTELGRLGGRKRWDGLSKEERSKLVPRNGGRPRKHPQCPRYKTHQFRDDRCPCGYTREKENA